MTFDPISTIVNDAAVEMGLGTVSDVFGSTDANIVQLRTILKSVGRDLSRLRDWAALTKEYTFSTTAAASYALPADFRCFIDNTQWNRTAVWPLGGPLMPAEWQTLQAFPVTPYVSFRLWKGALYVWPSTNTGQTIAFEYVSTFWLAATGSTTPTIAVPAANTDVVLFDPNLAVKALKLAFLKAKGFDTTAALSDYSDALNTARGDDQPAPSVTIGGRGSMAARLIDGLNIPETGYG